MTATERNNRLYENVLLYSGVELLAERFLALLHPYVHQPENRSVEVIPDDVLISRLRQFITRGKRDGYTRKSMHAAQKLADHLQSLQKPQPNSNGQTNEDLLKEIERLRSLVLSSSPSGKNKRIQPSTKRALRELYGAMTQALECEDLGNIISADRLRIFRMDLTYLSKREHLFAYDIPQKRNHLTK